VKRLFWALFGIGVGAVVGAATVRWVGRTAHSLKPDSVARRALHLAGDWRVRLAEAVDEGRLAMAEREAELRALYAGPDDEAP
jgi:hypothetical protein